MISIMVSHFDYKHRCPVEKNVPIALILPSRSHYGAESLGVERTSCLCQSFALLKTNKFRQTSFAILAPHFVCYIDVPTFYLGRVFSEIFFRIPTSK